jgi:hypothetical protein
LLRPLEYECLMLSLHCGLSVDFTWWGDRQLGNPINSVNSSTIQWRMPWSNISLQQRILESDLQRRLFSVALSCQWFTRLAFCSLALLSSHAHPAVLVSAGKLTSWPLFSASRLQMLLGQQKLGLTKQKR